MSLRFISRAGVILLCVLLCGCTNMKTYEDPGAGADWRIQPGRFMVITTTDGELLKLYASAVTEHAIEGKLTRAASRGPTSAYGTGEVASGGRVFVRVPVDKIERLQMRGLDGEAIGIAVGVVAACLSLVQFALWSYDNS